MASRFQAGQLADAESPVVSLAISPDARLVAASSSGGALSIWDTTTGAMRFRLPDASVDQSAFAADGKPLSTTNVSYTPEKGARAATIQVVVRDISNGRETAGRRRAFEVGELGQHLLTEDGSVLIAFSSDVNLRMWDLAKGGEI